MAELHETAVDLVFTRTPTLAGYASSVWWLMLLAAPRAFGAMERKPPPDHLLRMLDLFLVHVRSGAPGFDPAFEPAPHEQREPRAAHLRTLLEAWTPPDLTGEISEAARALLHAEGHDGPPGGGDWESLFMEDFSPEEQLFWPEGIPALLREQRAEAASPAASKTLEEWLGPKRTLSKEKGYVEITCSIVWNEQGTIYGQRVVRAADGSLPAGAEYEDVFGFVIWLMVLAAPPLYRTLERAPDRNHLLRLIDIFLVYAAGGVHLTRVEPASKPCLRLDQRDALARKLRALIEAWTPPALPAAITAAARALVEAEGVGPPPGGWDELNHPMECPLEDILLWPEGIPLALRAIREGERDPADPSTR